MQLQQRTEKYRRQHEVLVDLAVELQTLSQNIESLPQAKEARTLLDRFAGKLVVHLAKEDKSLYPDLEASGNREVMMMAQCFKREMGGLAETFNTYTRKWVSPDKIVNNADEFRSETAAIVDTLAKRIDRENNELYAMADSI